MCSCKVCRCKGLILMLCFQINELVDCRDVSIGAWFEATIERVTLSNKGSKSKAETAASSTGRAGRNGKRINGKVETEADTNGTMPLNSNSEEPSTSQTEAEDPGRDHISYHIKYEEWVHLTIKLMFRFNRQPYLPNIRTTFCRFKFVKAQRIKTNTKIANTKLH